MILLKLKCIVNHRGKCILLLVKKKLIIYLSLKIINKKGTSFKTKWRKIKINMQYIIQIFFLNNLIEPIIEKYGGL
jgi:hypothetical protein